MKRLLLLAAAVQLTLLSFSQGACSLHRYQDTVFHTVLDTTGIYFGTATPYGILAQPQDLLMDIYSPAGDTLSKRPLIVFQFGGGFTIGWRTEPDIPGFCEYFAKCGYVVATIDYRIGLNPLDTMSTVRAFYRGWQDERSAIRFLCEHASQFRIDTSTIFLTGTSAGCFCALANGFMTNANRPAASYGISSEPADLGCIDCSGNNDFNKHIPHIKGIINQWGAVMDTNVIEAADNVPVISFHGDQDVLVPYEFGYPFQLPVFPKVYGSKPIHERLNNQGILNEFHTLVGYGHEPELVAPQLNDTIYNYSRPFLFKLIKPVTSAINGPLNACTDAAVTYSAAYIPGSKYCWTLSGNGQIVASTDSSISVTWHDAGNVSVAAKELNYLDAEGATQTFGTHVVKHAQADFTNVNNQLAVTLTNLSTNATSYTWSFGDNTTSSDTSLVKNYAGRGTYTVMLVADNGVCTDTMRKTIDVTLCPVAHFTTSEYGLNVNLVNTSEFSNTYLWTFGDGTSSTDSLPAKLYADSGTYTIMLVADNGFCTDSATATITVDACPIAHFTNTVTVNNCFLYADSTNTIHYYWNFGDGDSAGVNFLNVFHQYKHSGTYLVTLRTVNHLGCESIDTATVVIDIPSGIDGLNDDAISILCNDVTGCKLNASAMSDSHFEVYDIAGRIIEQHPFDRFFQLSTTNYHPGIYFVKVESGDEIVVKKFVSK